MAEEQGSGGHYEPSWGEAYSIPGHRLAILREVSRALLSADQVIVTTHVNADGDGAGSEAALTSWLRSLGKLAVIVNPTPFPEAFRFLVEDPDWIVDPASSRAAALCEGAAVAVVLDTGEVPRIGRVKPLIDSIPKIVIDHHPLGARPIDGLSLRDASACATGELVYDLLLAAGEPWTMPVAAGIYVAILTDTGSFRYSNTTPDAHRIAANLVHHGVDPEEVYRHLFGNLPLRRFQLLRASLEYLEVDELAGVGWMTVPVDTFESLEADADDIEGLVEYPRSLRGVEVAMLFRTTRDGAIKVSFRSNGSVDVNALAARFGGGGHEKASGARVEGVLEEVRREVIARARDAVRDTWAAEAGGSA